MRWSKRSQSISGENREIEPNFSLSINPLTIVVIVKKCSGLCFHERAWRYDIHFVVSSHGEPQAFLEKLYDIFGWGKCESSETIGNKKRLSWYAVILRHWVSGNGLGMIIDKSLTYAQNSPNYKVRIGGQLIPYNHQSMMHRNIVMSETLQAIESVVLFSFANYFLRFSEAYKRIHGIEGEMNNDWYEFVEYGTTNKLTIFLQRNGLSRETALFIRKNRSKYVVGLDDSRPVKIKKDILNCGNFSVISEVENMSINNPDLFVD
jgi:hypothetical protein